MTYSETLKYLYNQLPMYQRIGIAAYKADLSNTIALCRATGNPEKNLICIHVAGTNGKGSTSHLLASVFMEAGYKVGLYTSPHLKDFRERITINGKKIAKNFVVDFTNKHKKDFAKISPSFFEMTVVMAFSYFKEKKTDIAIIETGMGGRLDSTNVINPEISIITTISKDHVQFLGNNLKSIAREKGGIIKNGIPLVKSFTKDKIVLKELDKICKERKTELFLAPSKPKKNYKCELKGPYQQENISTAITAIKLMQLKDWKITEKNLRTGISKVITNTHLSGRWQVINKKPLAICDIGHNEEGIKEIVKGIKKIKYNKLHFVVGMVNDKDVSKILSLLPKKADYYFCKAKIPRAMNENELQKKAAKFNLKGGNYVSVRKAYQAAIKKADKNDLIFIGGSAFVAGEII